MKFLPPDQYHNDIIPINIIYDKGEHYNDDCLTIIYKDLGTNQKQILTIYNPIIEVYITKKTERDYTHVRDWIKKDRTVPVKVHYKSRYSEIAKLMGLSSPEEARTSPYVFGADVEIVNYYYAQFALEYPTKKPKKLSLGFLDIENDVIRNLSIPAPGTTPINAVTYVDGDSLQVFEFVLVKDYLPPVDMTSPDYVKYEELKTGLYEQAKKTMAHVNEYIQDLHDKFDEPYGELDYHVFFFDDEMELMKALWKIIRDCDNDFVEIWNMPYDMQNLMKRPSELGHDPNTIIIDPRFLKESSCHTTVSYQKNVADPKYHVPILDRHISFFEDKNPQAHRRKHECVTYTMMLFVDQMVHYAGIRASRGRLPSLKLSIIAKKEIGDDKLDYSEDGDIRHLYYANFYKFMLYNLKDVLLLLGIERKTGDMDVIYNRMYTNTIPNNQSFTTTKVVLGSLSEFGYERGYVFGANRNKFGDKKTRGKIIDYGAMIRESDDDEDLFFDDSDEDEEEGDGTSAKREKYQGAFVMNPLHMSPTGYYILGRPSKYVHEWVVDYDVTSEYPTSVCICNISNETLVGKVFLDAPEEITIPIYPDMKFRGDEATKYKLDVSNFMMECYSERDYLNFGTLFLDLPSPTDLFEDLEKHLNDLI